jgi:putative membrane protein
MGFAIVTVTSRLSLSANGPAALADSSFVVTASQANYAEIAAGKLAGEKAATSAIRTFGDSLVADHTLAQQDLVRLAQKENITLPPGPDTEHQQLLDTLSGLTGRTFDSAYLSMQLLDHEVAVQLFQQEAESGKDSLTRQYATRYLPVLRHHLLKAKRLWGR